jgi:glycosyltransferase involved in cell wall biosynthesis
MRGQPIRILELRSVRGIGGGPEKTILFGAARSDPRRFAVTICYIRDRRDDVFALDLLAAKLDVDYVEILERHSFDRSIWPSLRRLVRERRIDIVHSHDYKTDCLAFLLARVEGVRPMSTVHGWIGRSVRERWVYYPADRRILRTFPRVIAVSGPIRHGLIQSGLQADRLALVLNGIDGDRFRRRHEHDATARAALSLPVAARVLGAIGRLEREKRFDVLLEAVAILRQTRPDVHLVIAGSGSLGPALLAQARRLGITEFCSFLGHQNDVTDVFHSLDVFVQSSDTEGTPNAVLEAMALEVPVVATSVGGTVDLITDGVHGRLVPRRHPDALAAAIARTLDDPAASASQVAAARKRVEQELSFARRMETVEKIYEELVEDGAAPGTRDLGAWVSVRAKR